MKNMAAQFAGVELYFDDLDRAKKFYAEVLGLRLSEGQAGHFAKFDGGAGFICLERKGSESYPSAHKAVLFFEVPDLQAAITEIGRSRLVRAETEWAVLRDPEDHNVLLLQRGSS
jgi:predicted enzyme related to lactoylglutathione lyase